MHIHVQAESAGSDREMEIVRKKQSESETVIPKRYSETPRRRDTEIETETQREINTREERIRQKSRGRNTEAVKTGRKEGKREKKEKEQNRKPGGDTCSQSWRLSEAEGGVGGERAIELVAAQPPTAGQPRVCRVWVEEETAPARARAAGTR